MTEQYLHVTKNGQFNYHGLIAHEENAKGLAIPFEQFHSYEFSSLPDATKAHLIGIQSLVAEYEEGYLPYDVEWLEKRLFATDGVDFDLLEEHGFIEINSDCNSDSHGLTS